MHIVGKVILTLCWMVFSILWLFLGMGPPIMAFAGYFFGDVPGDMVFLMALYAFAMILLLCIAIGMASEDRRKIANNHTP